MWKPWMGGGRKWKNIGIGNWKKNTTTTTLGRGIELFSLKPCPFGRLQERAKKSEATTIPEAVFGGLSFLGMLAVPFWEGVGEETFFIIWCFMDFIAIIHLRKDNFTNLYIFEKKKSCLFHFQRKVVFENQHILPTYIPTPKQDPSSSESNFHNGAYINRIHQFSMPGR